MNNILSMLNDNFLLVLGLFLIGAGFLKDARNSIRESVFIVLLILGVLIILIHSGYVLGKV